MRFQCENGHVTCSFCCTKVMKECPFCSPLALRNRAIEKVIESVEVRCRNKKYGCEKTMSYNKRDEHEKTCLFTPCSCPLPDCNYKNEDFMLNWHFHTSHRNSATRFRFNNSMTVTLNANDEYLILQEEEGHQLFVLKNSADHLGNLLYLSLISCAGHNEYFYYDILAKSGESTHRFQSSTNNIQMPEDNHPSIGFMIIPSKLFGSKGQLELDICIWGHSASPPNLTMRA